MYRLWSELEIGESHLVFASLDSGMAWLRANPALAEIAEGEKQTIDECISKCFDIGYFDWEQLEVIA